MTNNSSDMPPFPSPSMLALAYGIATVEIFVHFATASIASINLVILVPTKILHQNLKFILLCQSATILLAEVIRLAMIGQKFVLNDIFNPISVVLQTIIMLCGSFRKAASHVLLIERSLATVFFHSYEKRDGKYFTIGWLTIVITISIANSFGHESWNYSIINLYTFGFSFFLSIAELVAIILIGTHNRALKDKLFLQRGIQNMLSQRYQLMENILTCKQLRPSFICYIIKNLIEGVPVFIFYFNILSSSPYLFSIVMALWILSGAFLSAIIEIMVITHHPLLKKRFNFLLKQYLCRGMFPAMNVHPMEITASQEKEKAEKATREMDEHFRMLKHTWDYQDKQR